MLGTIQDPSQDGATTPTLVEPERTVHHLHRPPPHVHVRGRGSGVDRRSFLLRQGAALLSMDRGRCSRMNAKRRADGLMGEGQARQGGTDWREEVPRTEERSTEDRDSAAGAVLMELLPRPDGWAGGGGGGAAVGWRRNKTQRLENKAPPPQALGVPAVTFDPPGGTAALTVTWKGLLGMCSPPKRTQITYSPGWGAV